MIFGILANIVGIYIIYKLFFAPLKIEMSSLYSDFIKSAKTSLVNSKIKISNNEIFIEGENLTSKMELQLIHKSKCIYVFVYAQNVIYGEIQLKLDFSHGFEKSNIYGVVEDAFQKEMINKIKV